jgi:hypothetical protein
MEIDGRELIVLLGDIAQRLEWSEPLIVRHADAVERVLVG